MSDPEHAAIDAWLRSEEEKKRRAARLKGQRDTCALLLHAYDEHHRPDGERLPKAGEPEAIFLKRFPRVPATLKAWLSVEAMRYLVSDWVVAVLTAEPDDPADIIRILEGMQPPALAVIRGPEPSDEQAAVCQTSNKFGRNGTILFPAELVFFLSRDRHPASHPSS